MMKQTTTKPAEAKPGYECWLRYVRMADVQLEEKYRRQCRSILLPAGSSAGSAVLHTAINELTAAIQGLTGQEPEVKRLLPGEESAPSGSSFSFIGLGSAGQLSIGSCMEALGALGKTGFEELGEEGYRIRMNSGEDEAGSLIIAGQTDRGVLYGVFHFIRLLQMGVELDSLDIAEKPDNGLRMIDHWDNMDGSIERGYAGRSIFFRDNACVEELPRIRDYARLMASIGINAVAVNNVNVHAWETRLITSDFLPAVKRLADVFRDYGIRLFLSVNFAAPIELDGLETADPLDAGVREWWREKAADIYRTVPDFGGFLVKADSEFRPGPFTYGRDHNDGANMLAEALEPYGGLVIWRCFVYNCQQDWRDRRTDRARAAYDHFKPLDGKFQSNVVLQIKNGPMDFQVREPVSPLIGGLAQTSQLLELQITQEYTGQQKHLCYLVPQWKEILAFDTYAKGEGSTVAATVSGVLFRRPLGGIAAVANIGDDGNWTGHLLAQANWYGYGRLAWQPSLSAEDITREWVRRTFVSGEEAERTIAEMLLRSWSIYEAYTAPLGVGWMVNPEHHYGPNVDGYEYSKWGTYHFADCSGIGVDRTAATGTGYAAQYHSPQAERYESLADCPDELLLFFHHVPYTHKLKSGKTVIQHIYDTHFAGAERAKGMLEEWDSLQGSMDHERFAQVRGRLAEQAEHAQEWRDVINSYFFRKSGIPDEHHRLIY